MFLAASGTAGGNNVWIRSTDQLESHALTAIGTSFRNPCFSPDGKWVAFTDGYDVKKVSVDGGPVVTLATVADLPNGLSWGSNGFLVVGKSGRRPFPHSRARRRGPALPNASGEGASRWPLFLPDGRTIVYRSVREGGVAGVGAFDRLGG